MNYPDEKVRSWVASRQRGISLAIVGARNERLPHSLTARGGCHSLTQRRSFLSSCHLSPSLSSPPRNGGTRGRCANEKTSVRSPQLQFPLNSLQNCYLVGKLIRLPIVNPPISPATLSRPLPRPLSLHGPRPSHQHTTPARPLLPPPLNPPHRPFLPLPSR